MQTTTLELIEGIHGFARPISQRREIPIEDQIANELAQRMEIGLDGIVMDVRKPTEFLSHHVVGATNFPLDYVNQNMNKLDRNETFYIHCLGGFRSTIMSSILRSRGFENLVDITEGWREIEESSVPKLELIVCP